MPFMDPLQPKTLKSNPIQDFYSQSHQRYVSKVPEMEKDQNQIQNVLKEKVTSYLIDVFIDVASRTKKPLGS